MKIKIKNIPELSPVEFWLPVFSIYANQVIYFLWGSVSSTADFEYPYHQYQYFSFVFNWNSKNKISFVCNIFDPLLHAKTFFFFNVLIFLNECRMSDLPWKTYFNQKSSKAEEPAPSKREDKWKTLLKSNKLWENSRWKILLQ